MSDPKPSIDDLRARAEAAQRDLAAAEAAHAAQPLLTPEEISAIVDPAFKAHAEAGSPQDKHDIAHEALRALEVRRHKGRETDQLAQLVIDAREALTAQPQSADPAPEPQPAAQEVSQWRASGRWPAWPSPPRQRAR